MGCLSCSDCGDSSCGCCEGDTCSLFSYCKKVVCGNTFAARWQRTLSFKQMAPVEKQIVKERFLYEVKVLERQVFFMSFAYTLMSLFIMVSGILITSFLSLEKIVSASETTKDALFWTNWSLSILIVIINRTMSIFSMKDKKMIMKDTLQKYYNEGWLFAESTHKYQDPKTAFGIFINKIERINSKSYNLVKNLNKTPNDKMDTSVVVENSSPKEQLSTLPIQEEKLEPFRRRMGSFSNKPLSIVIGKDTPVSKDAPVSKDTTVSKDAPVSKDPTVGSISGIVLTPTTQSTTGTLQRTDSVIKPSSSKTIEEIAQEIIEKKQNEIKKQANIAAVERKISGDYGKSNLL